jgi:flagellar hook-associated protein 2
MAGISSSVGILSGIPIKDTVDKLIAIASQPKDILTDRTKQLQSEQSAISQLSSKLLALQFESNQLASEKLFQSKSVASSNTAALTAAIPSGGNPAIGKYSFTPVQTAASQQFLSQSFGATEAIGAGSFTFQRGGFVDKGISLDELNSGNGVQRGKFRVTDRAGDSTTIDLSFARTVDDVLAAFNENTEVNVTAAVVGDRIELTDNTSGTGNLIVKDVGGGKTAADLGLGGINTSDASALGTDVFTLHTRTKLSSLNGGTGVRILAGAADLSVTLADGTELSVDLEGAQTLGDVITKINAVAPSQLSAAIAADGNRLELHDLTSGGGTFSVANVGDGNAADGLGLTTTAAGDTITGSRLVAGLRDTLLTGLKGGQGLGTLGSISITNRNNVTSSVDLSAAETIGDVIAAINSQATGVTASFNASHGGIALRDNTQAIASNLIVADGDATNSATTLGISVDAAVTSVDSGSLGRSVVSKATTLDAFKGSTFTPTDLIITDSAGHVGAVDLNPTNNVAKTVGDVIDRINALTIGVEARINDEGDGIALIDTAGGVGKLTVKDVTGGSTAKTLRIAGESTTATIDGQSKEVIDGTSRVTITIGEEDNLADVVTKINDLKAGVTASLLNDGTGPRLSLKVDKAGAANAVLLDAKNSSLSINEVTSARDALLLYGTPGNAGSVLLSSTTDDFTNVVDGLNISVKDGTRQAVTVTVATSNLGATNAIQEFVDAYNSIRDLLDQTTDFDPDALTTGILFGTNEALRVETGLSDILTGRFFGVGNFTSLAAIGITIDDKGKLAFDQTKYASAVAADPESVKQLFIDKDRGLAAKIGAAVDQLAGPTNSLLSNRTDSLTQTIDSNNDRINALQDLLDRQRDRLTAEFQRLDSVVAAFQQNQSALESLTIIPPLGTTTSK